MPPTTLAVVQAQAAAAAQQHHFGGHFQAPQHPQQQQQPQQPEVVRPHPTEMVKPVDKPSSAEEENKKQPPGFNATSEPVILETKVEPTSNVDQMPTIDDWSEDVAKEEDNEMNRGSRGGRGGMGRGGGRGHSNFRGRGGKNFLTPSRRSAPSSMSPPCSNDNDYRFTVSKLPVWAKKQLSATSPGLPNDPDLPKGRWAARIGDHVTVKSHYVSDSIITRPLQGILMDI